MSVCATRTRAAAISGGSRKTWVNDYSKASGARLRRRLSTAYVGATHPNHLRRGAAATLLRHMITEARSRNLKRLCLETGSGPAFDAALTLYRKFGFTDGDTFSHYARTDFNQFLHLTL